MGQCDYCGHIAGYGYPPANGHTYGKTDDGEYYICTVCGEILGPTYIGHGGVTVDTEHKHSYNSVVTAPTCISEGYTMYSCACGESYKGDETAPVGHSFVETDRVDSTCESTGYYIMTCTACGCSESTDIPAHHYKLESHGAICYEEITYAYVCTECEDMYYEVVAGRGEHNYTDTVCPCGPDAYIDHRCNDCGYITREHIEATYPDHNCVEEEGLEPGCRRCTQCGFIFYFGEI